MKGIKPILTIHLILHCVFLYLCVISVTSISGVPMNARGSFLAAQIKGKENYQHHCATCERKKQGCHMARINLQKY